MSDKDVEVLKRDVQRILNYLHNDEDTGTKGLVAEVAMLKKSFGDFMTIHKAEKAFKKGQIVAFVAIGTAAGWALEFIIKLLAR